MYIHLGNGYVIKTRDIIGVFDLDNTTVSARTRQFLNKAEKSGKIVITAEDLPKSFVVTADSRNNTKIYLSQLASSTLFKRNTKNKIGNI